MIRETKELENADFKRKFMDFLKDFRNRNNETVYVNQANAILGSQKRKSLVVSLKDFMNGARELCEIVTQEYYKHGELLNEVATAFVRDIQKDRFTNQGNQQPHTKNQKIEKYTVAFEHIHSEELRALKCESLGKLIAFRGTVTRTTEVRPQLIEGVFKCLACQQFSLPVPQQFKYTEPKKCKTVNCDANKWELEASKCQFADFQKIRVQQDPTSIPAGAMPRSIDVVLRNEMTEKAQPGDICQFIGLLCVLPDISSMIRPGERTQMVVKNTENRGNAIGMEGVTGLKQTGVRDLNYKLVFIANNIRVQNNQFNEVAQEEDEFEEETVYTDETELAKISQKFTKGEFKKIYDMKENPDNYTKLAESLFPAIYGNIQIKKAILLQLFSGIHKTTKTKINIRGDLNILIVGDPSTAKSQFLKSVQQFVPRSVYTSGKTTSAAGLTATVTRDENGDVGIEAGALMLADNGVCCIDEFDKMDTKDQVAIHEAMQQQTISIAKAGIYATLNARTSILAAANPVFGRYDKSKSLKNNLNLSAPIMSRFDLYFVICDQSDDFSDTNISRFIINMHKNQERAVQVPYTKEDIKKYIQFGRRIKPRLTRESAELLRKFYKQLRNKDKVTQNTSYRITVRQLESMIRLSEALARLHISFQIKPDYVHQAYRLLNSSILKLEKSSIDLDDEGLVEGFSGITIGERKDQNLMEQELRNKQKQKKTASVQISYEVYNQMQRNILTLFKLKEEQFNQNSQVDSDQPFGLSQSDIVDYIVAINQDAIVNMEQLDQMKKFVNAIIKSLIEKQKVLVVNVYDVDVTKRILGVHPNFAYE